ncbi:MAG: adenylate/guanylate cyclase domain-containing protein [Dehalococcoidia bacterium]|nr:adenylate/guanylate cyclase domain-containing protein [Dehalococcoidia bacterium]
MKCGSCGFDTPADFAFCPKCGGKLSAECPSCGFDCPPDFAFCPKCGAQIEAGAASPVSAKPALPTLEERLSTIQGQIPEGLSERLRAAAEAGAAEGERRPVTILFADISGFTALSETLDPELVATLVDRSLKVMAESIYRYEGTIDKYIGDCVMALFGAPIAHEDDPERAVRAALDMRDAVGTINRELVSAAGSAATDDPILSVHIGINTGVVVAGAVGSDRQREYTVLGDAVNVASRLEAAAESGEVVVGEPTYRLSKHAVAYEPMGGLDLKGKSEPLPAYCVQELLANPQSARGLEAHALSAPLVGRDDELNQMLTAFQRMVRGRTQVVSLIGEAGAGKSRLQREFFAHLEADGILETARVTIRRADCSSLGEQSYGVIAAFFRDAFAISADEPPEAAREKIAGGLAALGTDDDEIARSAPLVGHVLGVDYDDPRLRYIEPEQLKRQIFLAVRDVVERRLQQGPVLLVVEDLHWADAASVELLRYMVDRMGDRQFMLLLAHRPSFDAGALASGRATYTAIRLVPLSADQSEAMLEAFFGDFARQLPTRLRELIVNRAGGNPFYLEEVVRSLVEAGVLTREGEDWTYTEQAGHVDVPATVEGVLLAHLDRLPPSAKRLVQEAAVLGTAFEASLLHAVVSEPDAIEVYLDLLYDAELVEERPRTPGASEHEYRFLHTLAQEVAYQSLLVRRRTELHGKAGAFLEEDCGGNPERLEDLIALGHHFSLSNEKEKGARYLIAAGDWSRDVYANEDAARHYQQALETLSECDEATCRNDQLAVRERLGDVLGPAGERDEAAEHYSAALLAHAEAGDGPAQARLERKLGALCWAGGDRERARSHFQAGLDLLDGKIEHIELAHLYQEMGRLSFRTGDNQEAMRWGMQALGLAEQLAPKAEDKKEAGEAIAHANNTLRAALARMGELDEAVGQIEQGVAVANEHDLPHVACRAYTNLGMLYSTLDPGRAIETCLAGLELAKKIGDLSFQSWLYANLAWAYCTFTGQCEEEGIVAAQAAIDLDRKLGQLDHLAVPLIVLGQIYQCHGEPDLSLQCYTEAMSLAEEMAEPQLLFPCYDGLATLYLELDDEEHAEEYMLKGMEICDEAGLEADTLVVLPFLC